MGLMSASESCPNLGNNTDSRPNWTVVRMHIFTDSEKGPIWKSVLESNKLYVMIDGSGQQFYQNRGVLYKDILSLCKREISHF